MNEKKLKLEKLKTAQQKISCNRKINEKLRTAKGRMDLREERRIDQVR
jgi:hypothetical protein